MRERLVMLLAIALAAVAVTGALIRLTGSVITHPPKEAHASLAALPAAYLGVFEPGSPPGYGGIADFTQAAGRKPNLVEYYSGWAEPFNTSFAEMISRHGIIPMVQIDPTDASMPAIAAGTYDDYLRSYADSVIDFGHAVVIGFGHEMNAPWYSWGYRHLPPSTFVAAWRHVVTLFRREGADNVTWVGIDGYYFNPRDTFASVFGKTIGQVRAFASKPVLLSETAVGPEAGQFAKIQDLFHGMAAYKTLGLVWFDKAQHGGLSRQDWRIEDSYLAKTSFALGASQQLAPALLKG